MNQKRFNDLATVAIYHFCDVCVEPQAKKAARRLKINLKEAENAESLYDEYEAQVVAYAQDHLPDTYKLTYDYYGAKTFSNHQGWNAPKQGFYSGDNQGRIMLFEDFQALQEYTERILKEIQNETPL